MNRPRIKINLIDFGLIILSIFNIIFENYNIYTNGIMGLILLSYSIIFCILSKNYFQFWIMSMIILYFNYSIVINDYLLEGIKINLPYYEDIFYYGLLINLQVIFLSIIKSSLKKVEHENRRESLRDIRKDNALISVGMIIIIVCGLVWGINFNEGIGYIVRITSFYEYLYIFILAGLLFSKNHKILEATIVVLSVLVCLQDLAMGGRITSLQIIIMMLVYFENFLSRKKVSIGMLMGIVLFNIVGMLRNMLIMERLSIEYFFSRLTKNNFTIDTAYYAWYTSVTNVISKDLSNIKERLENFLGFFFNIFGISLNGYSVLPTLAKEKGLYNLGGGVVVSYFYFWFGIVGVFFVSLFVKKLLQVMVRFNYLKIVNVLSVIFCITVPRWYLYTPLHLIRPMLIFAIIYCVLDVFDQLIKNKNLKIKIRKWI